MDLSYRITLSYHLILGVQYISTVRMYRTLVFTEKQPHSEDTYHRRWRRLLPLGMPRGPVDRECRACQGAHRAHTCRRRGNAQPSVVNVADKATKLPKTKAVFSEALQLERPAMKEVDRLKLVALQNELKGSHAIQTIAAAKELLDGDGECDRNALCAKHGITASPAAL